MPVSYNDLLLPGVIDPVATGITEWHRLEADPTALDLIPGLEARIADPLWLIGRQWQLGELRGEDAGTPIQVFLSGSLARLDLRQTDIPEDASETIWEPHVEAEADAIHAYGALTAEAGIDLERALVAEGGAAAIPAFRASFRLMAFDELANNPPADRQHYLMIERWLDAAIDGATLLQSLSPLVSPGGDIAAVPDGLAVADELRDPVLKALTSWFADWADMFVKPMNPQSWVDRRLEYSFDIDTDAPNGRNLHVEEYSDGRVDWWSLDFGEPSGGQHAPPRKVEGMRIPVPVRYAGMPADRYFEFEDGSVNFGALSGGSTSLAAMMMLEYMLAASNDWFHLPLTLEYGHSFTVETLTVTDTFGRKAEIGRAGRGPNGWSMFEVAFKSDPRQSGATFVLPAVVAQTIEGDPIEDVTLFRDEMANLVWGSERIVPGLGPKGVSRLKDGRVVYQKLDTTGLTDASFIYRMQTPVPISWQPLVAIQDPDRPLGKVLFQRRNLKRLMLGADGAAIEIDGLPRGVLLQGKDGVFEIEESEAPRSGVVITRSFQMARNAVGERLVWLGRTKRTGYGEGSSGLRFDVLSEATDK